MEPLQRAPAMDALLDLRRRQESLLAELPIDLHREWEAKLGS